MLVTNRWGATAVQIHTCQVWRVAERWSPKELVVARAAVGIASVLLEVPQLKLLHTEGAGKVLRVELLPHGVDAVPQDRLLALCAERAP